MGILQIALFGDVRVTHTDWTTQVSITKEIQGLLAYLILQRHKAHSREFLADLFWGEHSQEKARGSLNTAIWKLKKALEPEGIPSGTYLRNTPLHDVGFNRESQYWLDIEVFEEKISEILIYPFQTVEETRLGDLKKVLGLYRGELLERFYADWALRERERLRALYLNGLNYLLQHYAFRGAYEKAIAYGQQILDLDPLREEIHREIMRLYIQNGQRTQALRQYEICCATLRKELDVSPMEDTQVLYKEILNRDANQLDLVASSRVQFSYEEALWQIREASQMIDVAKKQIQQALQMLTRYSGPSD